MTPYSLLFERLIHQQLNTSNLWPEDIVNYPTSLKSLKDIDQEAFMPVSLMISNHRIPDELMIQWYVAPSPQKATVIVDLAPTLTWSDYILSLSERELDPRNPQNDDACSRSLIMNLADYYSQYPWLVEAQFRQDHESLLSYQLGQLLGWVLQRTDSEEGHARLADILYRVKTKHLQVRPRWQRLFVKCSALNESKLPFQLNH